MKYGTKDVTTKYIFKVKMYACQSYIKYIKLRYSFNATPSHTSGGYGCWAFICLLSLMTSSNGTISALLVLCAGYSPVSSEFPSQRPVTRSFDVIFDLRLNKLLSKQSWGWWFETPSRSFWRYCNCSFTAIVMRGQCSPWNNFLMPLLLRD